MYIYIHQCFLNNTTNQFYNAYFQYISSVSILIVHRTIAENNVSNKESFLKYNELIIYSRVWSDLS